jgi:uncharacterized membrane protein
MEEQRNEKGDMLSTSRTEAFSDGVFAIAATLLVLELKVPHVEPGGLLGALLERWPSNATYAVSFLTLGIIWVNHHAVMDRIKKVNRPLLFLNLVFFMAVAAIQFPTALLADYLRVGHDERLAAALYGTTMAVMGIAFGIMWAYAVLSDDLLHEGIDPDRARRSEPVVPACHRGVDVECRTCASHLRALGPLLPVRRATPLESGEVRKLPPGHSLLGRPKAKAGGRRTE